MLDTGLTRSLYADELEVGSAEHRRALARLILDTHVEYDPEKIQWPALGEAARARLVRLPFWQEAVATEAETSRTVMAAVALEADPEVRRAIELQGFEEQRHARLLAALTAHYGIPVQTPPPAPSRSLEDEFLTAGFGECFDSFFAFGLFALASDSGFFAPELIAIFEPVVQEEARHILFFVNWVNYRRSQLPWWGRPMFRLRCCSLILKQVLSRMRTARSLGRGAGEDAERAHENFTLSAHEDLGADLNLHDLLGRCLSENVRRMAVYDGRLLRPRLVPTLARFLHHVLPASL